VAGLIKRGAPRPSEGARPQGRELATNLGEFSFDLESLPIRASKRAELFVQQLLDIE